MGLAIAFWILAVVGILAALGVVLLRNVFRAALSLILCFLAVAGLYVTLSADFLAAVQILIYVGAISVLIILAIMMTREVQQGNLSNKLQIPATVRKHRIKERAARKTFRSKTTPRAANIPTTASIQKAIASPITFSP